MTPKDSSLESIRPRRKFPTLADMTANNVSANKAQVPQPARPAHKSEASQNLHALAGVVSTTAEPVDQFLTGKPTLHGDPPGWARGRFVPAPPGVVPEFAKLPAPRERCPFTGASRSWLIDQAKAGNVKLVRVRQPGKLRGAVFVHVPTLLDFLRKQMEGQP